MCLRNGFESSLALFYLLKVRIRRTSDTGVRNASIFLKIGD